MTYMKLQQCDVNGVITVGGLVLNLVSGIEKSPANNYGKNKTIIYQSINNKYIVDQFDAPSGQIVIEFKNISMTLRDKLYNMFYNSFYNDYFYMFTNTRSIQFVINFGDFEEGADFGETVESVKITLLIEKRI